jgi:hypothetical protein
MEVSLKQRGTVESSAYFRMTCHMFTLLDSVADGIVFHLIASPRGRNFNHPHLHMKKPSLRAVYLPKIQWQEVTFPLKSKFSDYQNIL